MGYKDNMSFKRGLLCAVTVLLCFGVSRAQCPPRCQCFGTRVRCMFLQMETIPQVPPSTTILDLRFNIIKDIPRGAFRGMDNLDTLLLNNNELEIIRDGSFHGLDELRYLYLYENKIREIQSKAFKNLHKLEQLSLHRNEISRLPRGLFTFNKKLKRLRLDSNELVCDCEMVWLAKMLKENLGNTQAAATCDFPSNLKGRSLMEIDTSDFNCNKPIFTREPTDVQIPPGNTAYFTCTAQGSPTPEILWMKNNHIAATGSPNHEFEVFLTPALPLHPFRASSCSYHLGFNELSFFSQGSEIVDPNESRYNVLQDGTLMIENTRESDRGSYECIARNSAGEVKTNSVELIMTNSNEAPTFLSTPADVQAVLGDNVDLPCTVAGNPVPAITWTLNGRNIRLNSRVSIVGGNLHIISVRDEDSGEYRCRAENQAGIITASARLSVQVAPHFVLRPFDMTVPVGNTATFQCDAMGVPTPLISWYKSGEPLPNNGRFQYLDTGRTLRIVNLRKDDTDVYICRAESAAGSVQAEALLTVGTESQPQFSRRQIEELLADEGTDVVLECSDDEQSTNFRWIKDGNRLRSNRKFHIEREKLTIRRVIKSDDGIYECFAENSLVFARNSVKLNVTEQLIRPGDNFVLEAFERARNRVDNAINITRSELFDRGRSHSVQDLLSLFRYPSAEALQLARAEEVFEQTLELIHQHVSQGHDYDLEGHELSYRELVSPAHLSLIANMSGCFRRTLPQKCSSMCFHKKYRTIDGSCNNLQNPSWGSANSPLTRLLPAEYENGFNTPKGWNRARLYNGVHLPSPRLVSSLMMTAESVSTDNSDTHMVMQWGQFIDHDIDLTPQSVSQHIFNDGRRCNETCDNSFPCFPIPVPASDQRVRGQPCLGFHRSSATCNTGTTSIFFKTFAPRQQLNALTSYIDGSHIYGSSDDLAERLRDTSHGHGHLLVGSLSEDGKRLLPYDFSGIVGPADCQIEYDKRYVPCFLTGDSRANEQLGLTAMHTLWMREHNRIASELSDVNPHWDGDMLYNEARKVVGAMMQHITYTAWLPKVLGPEGMKMLGDYSGYNPSVDGSVTNEFATAAMRFGHSLIQPIMFRLNASFQPIAEGNLALHKAFFSPYRIVEEGGIDPILRGLFAQGAKMRMPNEIMNSELTEKLFSLANSIGQDLASLNIQRGRDHGLPFYNEYRKLVGLKEAESFDDFKDEIQDRRTRENLELLYSHVDNIDLFVGGMAETPLEGSKVGPTFTAILVDQFKRLRSGDRFWYENPMVFTPDQLVQIKQSTLARVMCDNGDAITNVQHDVFSMAHSKEDYVLCNDIPKMDLKMWSDCCTDCRKAGVFTSITSHFVPKRPQEFSFQNESPYSGRRTNDFGGFRGQIYNKQEVDTKMYEMKTRLEGMEGMMHTMEHSMKKMKRNMRKMMSHSADMYGCEDRDEQNQPVKRKHNQKWNKDDCTICKCKMGDIKCKTIRCPELSCENPKKMPGKCCLVC